MKFFAKLKSLFKKREHFQNLTFKWTSKDGKVETWFVDYWKDGQGIIGDNNGHKYYWLINGPVFMNNQEVFVIESPHDGITRLWQRAVPLYYTYTSAQVKG